MNARTNPTTRLFSVLIGERAALEDYRDRLALDDLTAALGDWPFVNSLDSQERAYRFLSRYGGRTTKRYARALLRASRNETTRRKTRPQTGP